MRYMYGPEIPERDLPISGMLVKCQRIMDSYCRIIQRGTPYTLPLSTINAAVSACLSSFPGRRGPGNSRAPSSPVPPRSRPRSCNGRRFGHRGAPWRCCGHFVSIGKRDQGFFWVTCKSVFIGNDVWYNSVTAPPHCITGLLWETV